MKRIIIFIILLIIITSCGPLIDPLRIEGEWSLESVEFYFKNTSIDALKIYTSTDSSEPDERHPVKGEFFNTSSSGTFTIDFENAGDFTISEKSGNNTYEIVKGSWAVESFNNSIILKTKDNSNGYGFWEDSFRIENPWPMSGYDTLKITIKASDVDKGSFRVDLEDEELKIDTMIGIFTKE